MPTFDLCNFNIEWESPTEVTLLDELNTTSGNNNAAAMGAYLVSHKNHTTSSNQLQIISAGSALIGSAAQMPVLSAIFGVILLAAISPVSLAVISEKEGELLKVLDKLKFGYIVNAQHVKAILRNDPMAEQLISKLCDIGLVKEKDDGTLWVKKCILRNLKIR